MYGHKSRPVLAAWRKEVLVFQAPVEEAFFLNAQPPPRLRQLAPAGQPLEVGEGVPQPVGVDSK